MKPLAEEDLTPGEVELVLALREHPTRVSRLITLALRVELDRNGGNVSATARALGMSRSSLHRRLKGDRKRIMNQSAGDP